MLKNIIIRNGHVIDPANNIDDIADIYVSQGRIVDRNAFDKADIEFDATHKYVFPGLIDNHAHVFPKSTEIGLDPDRSFLCQGVTGVVDAGSAGVSNIETFVGDVIRRSFMTVQGYINFCPSGMPTMKFHEDFNPKYWDVNKLQQYLTKYADVLQGVKIRISKPIMGDLGFEVFEQAEQIARKLNTRLCVHITNPYVSMEKVISVFKPGDVLAHCYQGTGETILNEDGTVLESVKAAQKRGVIMDAANGGNHWQFRVAEKALADGFYPDIISTDLTCKSLFKDPVFGLPFIMSKYILLGLSLFDIVKACTVAPAALLHGREKLGTLSVGAQADIAIFDLCEHQTVFSDTAGAKRSGSKLLAPQVTICKGEVVYKNILY